MARGIAFAVLAFASGCASAGASPGMRAETPRAHSAELDELARLQPAEGARVLLVVYPRTACSGSASTVLVTPGAGRFVGSVAPGTAALVEVPPNVRELVAISTVELDAQPGMWSVADHVRVPPAPTGLLLHTWRWNSRLCSNGQYADARPATKPELEAALGENDVRWLVPSPGEGQAWLDARHGRLVEVLAADRAYRVQHASNVPFPAGPLPSVVFGSGR